MQDSNEGRPQPAEGVPGEPEARGDGAERRPDPFVGRIVGGLYRVEHRIGTGGMGAVYSARHIHLEKSFAIKVLPASAAADERAVERLRQEAIAASRIDHDHIVDVVSFDATDEGEVFIVMEQLQGENLAALLRRGPLAPSRALTIASQIVDALGAAHDAGIVHRDLKPENVFLLHKRGREVVKVLDFGISKVKSAEAEAVRVTRTGQLVGTPLYMSPEQAKGETDVDARADLYALGVILYEMITGVPPFEGRNYFQLLWKHGNEAPQAPSRRAPALDIPLGVDELVLKALAKDPQARFQTAAEMREALDTAGQAARSAASPAARSAASRESAPDRAPGSGRAPSRRRWAAAAWAAAGVSVAAAVLALAGRGEPEEPRRAGRDSERGSAGVDGEPGAAATAASSPGTEAYASSDSGNTGARTAASTEDASAGAAASASDAATSVEVTFLSRPPGAKVRVGDDVLGTTPVVRSFPRGTGPATVRFSRPGYEPRVMRVRPEAGKRVIGRLRRKSPRPSARAPEAGEAAHRGRDAASELPLKKEL